MWVNSKSWAGSCPTRAQLAAGALRSVATQLVREEVPLSRSRLLLAQNKPDGFQCVSRAWAKSADHSPFEFCENGAKATLWESTDHRIGEEFFAKLCMAWQRCWVLSWGSPKFPMIEQ
jgi:hypothetical protein